MEGTGQGSGLGCPSSCWEGRAPQAHSLRDRTQVLGAAELRVSAPCQAADQRAEAALGSQVLPALGSLLIRVTKGKNLLAKARTSLPFLSRLATGVTLSHSSHLPLVPCKAQAGPLARGSAGPPRLQPACGSPSLLAELRHSVTPGLWGRP